MKLIVLQVVERSYSRLTSSSILKSNKASAAAMVEAIKAVVGVTAAVAVVVAVDSAALVVVFVTVWR